MDGFNTRSFITDEHNKGIDYSFTNIVPKESLRKVQLNTLEILASVLSKTAGPRGSNTQYFTACRPRSFDYAQDDKMGAIGVCATP